MKHIAVLIIAGGATWDRGTKATAGNGAVVTAVISRSWQAGPSESN